MVDLCAYFRADDGYEGIVSVPGPPKLNPDPPTTFPVQRYIAVKENGEGTTTDLADFYYVQCICGGKGKVSVQIFIHRRKLIRRLNCPRESRFSYKWMNLRSESDKDTLLASIRKIGTRSKRQADLLAPPGYQTVTKLALRVPFPGPGMAVASLLLPPLQIDIKFKWKCGRRLRRLPKNLHLPGMSVFGVQRGARNISPQYLLLCKTGLDELICRTFSRTLRTKERSRRRRGNLRIGS